MKFVLLSVCVLATAMVAYTDDTAKTIADIALHGASLTPAQVQKCREDANLTIDDLLTNEEIKTGSYTKPENQAKAQKNGCFVLCILEKRGLIVDGIIQTKKLYGTEVHAHLNPGTIAKIHARVDDCVKQVETKSDLCNKSLLLITCIWKDFI